MVKQEKNIWKESILQTIILVCIITPAGLFLIGPDWSLRFFLAGFWSVGNFFLLGILLKWVASQRPKWQIYSAAGLKLLGWYPFGAVLILWAGFEFSSFMAGFNLIFVVLLAGSILGSRKKEIYGTSK